jgi:ubiquinone/menaquinone biosynthesis C-methylase UbiE
MDDTKLAFGVEPSPWRYRLRLARYQSLAEKVAKVARDAKSSGRTQLNLLDIGVGNGRTFRYLEPHADLTERIRFVGLDNNPERRLAHVHGGDRWTLVHGDAEQKLPFDPHAFDVVIAEQILEHLHTPEATLTEMARVLRPGGTLIVGVPIFPPGLHLIRQHVAPRVQKLLGKKSDHVQTFTASSILRLINQTGDLSVTDVAGFRMMSGGVIRFLENYRWWWRFNRAVGRAVPSLCVEVQIVATKAPAPVPLAA